MATCNSPENQPDLPVTDPIKQACGNEVGDESLKDVPLVDCFDDKRGVYGQSGNGDPFQSGKIFNFPNEIPDRTVIPRNAQALRGIDQGMLDLFSDIYVEDTQKKLFKVPIIIGTQERAVAVVMNSSVRKNKDGKQDESLQVDRVKLPLMTCYASAYNYAESRFTYHAALNYYNNLRDDRKPGWTKDEKYKRDTAFGVARGIPIDVNHELIIWTSYMTDMQQILTQIFLKFSKVAYIKVAGVQWAIPVAITGIQNNIDMEPGDTKLRLVKYQISFLIEAYIPQPIRRTKTALSVDVDFEGTHYVAETDDQSC